MGALYRITFPNGKTYIGITTLTAEARYAKHVAAHKTMGRAVCVALREFGVDDPKLETLVIADDWGYLCDIERKAIALYGTKFPHGYNMTDGGELPSGLSEESRRKLSLAAKENPRRKGTTTSAAARQRMSESMRGRKLSAKAKANISASLIGNKYNAGRKLSEAHRKNLGDAQRKPGRPARTNGTSGHIGVSFDAANNKWRAHISTGRKTKCLGRFSDKDAAIAARLAAELVRFNGEQR